MTSQTAYVLTQGDYSDYRIIGVYSTKELAEEAKLLWPDSDVKDFSLDHIPDHPPRMFYWVGSIYEQMGIEELGQQVLKIGPDSKFFGQEGREERNGSITRFSVNIWATDKDHALKILHDKYHQYKAKQAGLV